MHGISSQSLSTSAANVVSRSRRAQSHIGTFRTNHSAQMLGISTPAIVCAARAQDEVKPASSNLLQVTLLDGVSSVRNYHDMANGHGVGVYGSSANEEFSSRGRKHFVRCAHRPTPEPRHWKARNGRNGTAYTLLSRCQPCQPTSHPCIPL